MSLNTDATQRPRGLGLHTKAPLISTIDIYGNSINLADLLKNHNGVLIDFFRGTWWTYWKEHLEHITKHYDELKERKIKIISIATDTPGLLKKYKETNNFPVEMVSDRGGKIAKDYNVYWFAEGWSK